MSTLKNQTSNLAKDEFTENIPKKVDIINCIQQIWGNNCEAWTLLQTENLSILEERMPEHTSDNMHYHTKADQFLYVLEGEVTVNIKNDYMTLTKNQGIHISATTPHCVINRSNESARFLLISSPYHRDDRVLVDL
ncbi:MAG: hypothetical protein Tsb005_12100 [Gammaproteobacteria bacterium]